jgi:hypothetical protein
MKVYHYMSTIGPWSMIQGPDALLEQTDFYFAGSEPIHYITGLNDLSLAVLRNEWHSGGYLKYWNDIEKFDQMEVH